MSPPPIAIARARGSLLFDEAGRHYIDGVSSWWVNVHGHCHPKIVDAIAIQAAQYDQVIFTQFTHEKAVRLADQLLAMLPDPFTKIFYTDNGSTAVEAALKMVMHYCKIHRERQITIYALEGGYHGDTFGAMSVGGKSSYSVPYWPYQFDVVLIPPPFEGKEHESLEALQQVKGAACFIFEPLIQGAGGMRIYPKEGLERLLQLCNEKGIWTIADEVMTGFGRTGPLFVSSTLATVPDVITLSKGITGGTLPLGVTACHERLFAPFASEVFLHGHSYTANPIACAAALASLDLHSEKKRADIHARHRQFCRKWRGHFKRIETLGTILVIEVESDRFYERQIRYFLAHNIYLRPLKNVLYVLPPYCITDSELDHIYQTIERGFTDEFHLPD